MKEMPLLMKLPVLVHHVHGNAAVNLAIHRTKNQSVIISPVLHPGCFPISFMSCAYCPSSENVIIIYFRYSVKIHKFIINFYVFIYSFSSEEYALPFPGLKLHQKIS